MTTPFRETTLRDLLDDPLTRTVMLRGISREAILRLLCAAARRGPPPVDGGRP
jgi:hypothetical protein